MHKVVWLLLCVCVMLASSAGPENHRTAHRPRLSSRLIPSRTTSTTPKPTTSTTLAPTTPSSTTASPDEEQKEVAELSTQVLAQKHQEELALSTLKPASTTAFPNINQFQGVPQSDLQQLLALMQAHQASTTNYPTFPPPNINFSPSAPGSFYGQQSAYPNIFNQDPYSQYQSSIQYPQIYNAQGQYQLPPVAPLPYNPPPTPNFVFKDGQYQVQAPNGQFQPIQFTTTTPVLPSFLTDIPANPSSANTASTETANTASANTATEVAAKSEPETGVQYATPAPPAVLPQTPQIYSQQSFAQPSFPQHSITLTQNGQTYSIPPSGQGYSIPQHVQTYSIPQNTQNYAIPQNTQNYAIPQNSQSYAAPQNSQAYSVPQNDQNYPAPQSSQSYPVQQNGQIYAGQQSVQQNSQPTFTIQQSHQIYPVQNQQSFDGQNQNSQISAQNSQTGQNYQTQQQQYQPATSQSFYNQQSSPLIHHPPVQQVTGQPQPSTGTHPFYQEQVVQSVSQISDTPRTSAKQTNKG